jgi:hypothetical protein
VLRLLSRVWSPQLSCDPQTVLLHTHLHSVVNTLPLPSQELEEGAEAVEQGVVKEARVIEEDLEKGLLSFGRGFTVLEDEVSQELAAELKQAKRALEKVGV